MASETIATIRGVRILNSHLDWTLEMTIGLADGRSGRGAAPKGETPSIYEAADAGTTRRDADLVADVARTLVGSTVDQGALDEMLEPRRSDWGASVVFALSVAFHEATLDPDGPAPARPPRLLFNLVNGGLHAYTNPVVTDLTEILVMPRGDDLGGAIDGYRRLLAETRMVLASKPTRLVGGNHVHELGEPANDAALDLARELLERTHLADEFDLALDASAGDWLDGDAYRLPVTGIRMDRDALVEWWLRLIDRHRLAWVEDPFAETDREGWRRLHDGRPDTCRILGDNLTSTLPGELEAKAGLIDGVLLKPDQNGTVSGSRAFAALARARGLALITSHRSIETDSPFLVHLSQEVGADAIKVGPYSDFSSVLRSNELLRTTAASTTGEAAAPSVPMTRRRARRLITVRHSLTAHNAAGIISGRLDEPLSDEGRTLAHEYVEMCGHLAADTVIASPMRRAIETAAILTGRSEASILVDPAAVERDYGELQGLDRDEVKRYAERIEYIEVGGIRHSLNPPGGESFEDVRARAATFRDHVEAMPPGTIVVVAHQVFLQQLHGLLLGVPTHDSLAMDIQSLQIDRFDLDVGQPVCHEVLHPGIQRYKSW